MSAIKMSALAFFVSLLANFLFYVLHPLFKRIIITRMLKFEKEESHGNYLRISIRNKGIWTVHKVKAYISIEHDIEDIADNIGDNAFVTTSNTKHINESRICWAFKTLEKHNLPEIDIFAREKVDINICKLNDRITIPSEEGWSGTKRVFLKIKDYNCKLKIVSEDTISKKLDFKIDTRNGILSFLN